MVKTCVLFMTLCFSSTLVLAQQTAPTTPATSSPTSQQEKSSPQSGIQTISGCLTGSPGNFTLTEDRTGTVYALTGNTEALGSNVGHEIEINGQPTTGGNAASLSSGGTANPKGGADIGSAPINTYEVKGVKVISDQCGTGSVTGPSALLLAVPTYSGTR
jgi:hypothetical protein